MLDDDEVIDTLCWRTIPNNVSLTSFFSWHTALVSAWVCMLDIKKSVLYLSVWYISTKWVLFHLFPYLTHIYKTKAVFVIKRLGKSIGSSLPCFVPSHSRGYTLSFFNPMWMFGERNIWVCVGWGYLSLQLLEIEKTLL